VGSIIRLSFVRAFVLIRQDKSLRLDCSFAVPYILQFCLGFKTSLDAECPTPGSRAALQCWVHNAKNFALRLQFGRHMIPVMAVPCMYLCPWYNRIPSSMVAEEFSLPVFNFGSHPEAFYKACKQFRGDASPHSTWQETYTKSWYKWQTWEI
jgi:hypothetical protein